MLAFGGCTSSSGSTQPEGRSDGSPSQTVSTASGDSARLHCGEYIGAHPPVRGLKVVLGVVALPTSGSGPALGTALTKDSAFPRLFAKTGLLIKEGASFRIIIPAGSGDRIGIGWGSPATPSRTVVVRHCRAVGLPADGWPMPAAIGSTTLRASPCRSAQADGRRSCTSASAHRVPDNAHRRTHPQPNWRQDAHSHATECSARADHRVLQGEQ